MWTRTLFLLATASMLAACSSASNSAIDAGLLPDAAGETTDSPAGDAPLDQTTNDTASDRSVGPPLIDPQSFVVNGRLKLTPLPSGGLNPTTPLSTTQDFTMHVDPTAKVLVIGNLLDASRATLKSSDGVTFETTSMLTLRLPTTACGSTVAYSAMKLQVGTDAVTGTAMGTALVIEGDIGWSYNARLDFTGTVDKVGPSMGDAVVDIDPVAGLFVKPSEPLAATVAAQLVAGGDMVNLTPFLPQGTGVVTGFNKPVTVALRYGTTYDVVVSPWADLAGNSGQPLPKLTTIAAPPLATEDGFEGATSSAGGVGLVGAPALPPITGTKSAFLRPRYGALGNTNADDSHLALRLPVQAGDTVVRFSLRPVGAFEVSASTYNAVMRLAVPGGAVVPIALPATEPLTTQHTNPADNRMYWLGDVRTVEAPLPAGAATEVVFDFNLGGVPAACGPLPPTAGYLLDDLRVE